MYGSFIGGSQLDTSSALAMTSAGSISVAGTSRSADLTTTPGAYDTNLARLMMGGFA